MNRKCLHALIYLMLAVVCIVALAAPIYNRLTPRLFGVPFFIWFQIVWVMVAGAATAVAHRTIKDRN